MLGVVTGLKSEAKLLKSLDLSCVITGGQAREARRKIDRLHIVRGFATDQEYLVIDSNTGNIGHVEERPVHRDPSNNRREAAVKICESAI